jgi:hypothetical protein
MRCKSLRACYPIRSDNVRIHAKQGVSAVAASRRATHDIVHHIAAILPKISAAVAIAPEIVSMRR